MDEPYAKESEFRAAEATCNTKMSEFERRETAIDKQLQELSKLVTEMAVTMKHNLDQTNDQENRIRALEGRRGEWFDKVVYAIVGALISFAATKLLGH